MLFERKIVKKLLDMLGSRHVLVIYGSRQVGKTSVMKYLLENHVKGNSFYLDLELKSFFELCEKGPQEVFEYLIQKGADKSKKIFLFIDEIHYLSDTTSFIKAMHDHFPQVKLIVSGSSAFEIRRKLGRELVGRALFFELPPLSFEEFLEFKGKKYSLKPENRMEINNELVLLAQEFIRFGGYPAIVLEPQEEKKLLFLSQIIDTYIKKDIRDIGKIKNISLFNKLLEILASQTGQLLNVTELAGTLGANRKTINQYIYLLEKTFILRLVSPYSRNLRSELSKNPKIFLLDTGIVHVLWLKEFPKAILGSVFETFVFTELLKNGINPKFWRTANKQEIDFIIESKKTILAVEAKLAFPAEKTSAMRAFAKKYSAETEMIGLLGEKRGKYVWELTKQLESFNFT